MILTNAKQKQDIINALNLILYKIENNIDIIDDINFNKLLMKFKEIYISYNTQSAYLVFGNGIFDLIVSSYELDENPHYQEYILIDRINNLEFFRDYDEFYPTMKKSLEDILYSNVGKERVKESCSECIKRVFSLYNIQNLNSLFTHKIPYIFASEEQKIFNIFSKISIPEETLCYVSISFRDFNPNINLDDLQCELLSHMYFITGGFVSDTYRDDVYETFKIIEQENLMKYMNSFLKSVYDFCDEY